MDLGLAQTQLTMQDRPEMNIHAKDQGVPSVLPADGTLVYVSPWRRNVAWLGSGIFIVIYLNALIRAVQVGGLLPMLIALFSSVMIIFALRMPMSGIILRSSGVTLRMAWWTFSWSWNEIDHFELGERGSLRLRVHLRDGRTKKAKGFFARSSEEEERCHLLFAALNERLEREQARFDADASANLT